MKSIALILQILLTLGMLGVPPIYSQTVGERPTVYPIPKPNAQAATRPPQAHQATRAMPRYYTHPEFTAIMTTTVTTPAQGTAEGYLFVATMGLFFAGQHALLILDNTGGTNLHSTHSRRPRADQLCQANCRWQGVSHL